MAKSKKKLLIVLGVLVGVLFVLSTASVLIVSHFLNKINRMDLVQDILTPEQVRQIEEEETADLTGTDEEEITDGEVLAPEEVKLEDEIALLDSEDLCNIILMGQDRRPGEGRARSDSMILCSINLKTAKVSMTSFQRDTWVQIPGHTDNRLNVAYRLGDVPLVYKTYEKNFGIKIDGAFAVDFDGFKAVIDALGGVDMNLTAGEAGVVGVHSGNVHLNGEQALTYSRIRHLDSEFKRTERQRKLLMQVFRTFKNSSPDKLLATLNTLLPYMSTDMSNTAILELAARVIPKIPEMEIETYQVPNEGEYRNARIGGRAVFVPDLEKIHDRLENEILPLEG